MPPTAEYPKTEVGGTGYSANRRPAIVFEVTL
jgi:hypothetical protein